MEFGRLYLVIMGLFDTMLSGLSSVADFSMQPFIDILYAPIDALPGTWPVDVVHNFISAFANWLTDGAISDPFYVVAFGSGLYLLVSFFVVKGILDVIL